MKRIYLSDRSHRWFNKDTATEIKEQTWHDGNTLISRATGRATQHEDLFITEKGGFVIREWSNYDGFKEKFRVSHMKEAILWLARNGYEELAQAHNKEGVLEKLEL